MLANHNLYVAIWRFYLCLSIIRNAVTQCKLPEILFPHAPSYCCEHIYAQTLNPTLEIPERNNSKNWTLHPETKQLKTKTLIF